MIARLSGTLAETTADCAIIDVGGVGYLVYLSGKTLETLGTIGGQVILLTELQVREDAWTLFGFGSGVERDAFRALTSVQGVGGRLARWPWSGTSIHAPPIRSPCTGKNAAAPPCRRPAARASDRA